MHLFLDNIVIDVFKKYVQFGVDAHQLIIMESKEQLILV